MTPKRASYVLGLVLLLVVGAGGGAFYLGDKSLQKKSLEISEEKANQEAVKTQLTIFEDSKEKVSKYGFVEELANKVLPESKLQSEVLAELTQFAANNGMTIQALTFSNGDATATDPSISQTETIVGLAGVRVLNASIQFANEPAISYNNFLNFLHNVETNQRKMQVTTLSLSPNPDDSQLIASATVTVNIFLKDTAPAPAPEATEGAPITEEPAQ